LLRLHFVGYVIGQLISKRSGVGRANERGITQFYLPLTFNPKVE